MRVKAQWLLLLCVLVSVTALYKSPQEIYSTQLQHHDKILHPSHCPPPSAPSPSPQSICPLTAASQIQRIPEIISVTAAGPFAVAQENMPPSPLCHASIVYNSDCLGEATVEMCLLHAFTPSISTARPGGV